MSKTLSAPVRGQGHRVQTQVEPCGPYDFSIHRIEILDGPKKGSVLNIKTWGAVDMRGIRLHVDENGPAGTIRNQIRDYCARNRVSVEIQ